MKDVQARGEAFSLQMRTPNTLKHGNFFTFSSVVDQRDDGIVFTFSHSIASL
jgi:hypothetical protein